MAPFGTQVFDKEEQAKITKLLSMKLGPNLVSQRPTSTEGLKIAYVETWKLISLANDFFGFNGWSSSITSQTIDFLDEEDGKYCVGVSACVRVTLKDGTHHEELGYGVSDSYASKGLSIEKARKEAMSDGLKRCLRNFGDALGNCLGDKEFLRWVVNGSSSNSPTSSYSSSKASSSLISNLVNFNSAAEETAANNTTTTTYISSSNEGTTTSNAKSTSETDAVNQQSLPQVHVMPSGHPSLMSTHIPQGAQFMSSVQSLPHLHQQQVVASPQLPFLQPLALAGGNTNLCATPSSLSNTTARYLLVRPITTGSFPAASSTQHLQQVTGGNNNLGATFSTPSLAQLQVRVSTGVCEKTTPSSSLPRFPLPSVKSPNAPECVVRRTAPTNLANKNSSQQLKSTCNSKSRSNYSLKRSTTKNPKTSQYKEIQPKYVFFPSQMGNKNGTDEPAVRESNSLASSVSGRTSRAFSPEHDNIRANKRARLDNSEYKSDHCTNEKVRSTTVPFVTIHDPNDIANIGIKEEEVEIDDYTFSISGDTPFSSLETETPISTAADALSNKTKPASKNSKTSTTSTDPNTSSSTMKTNISKTCTEIIQNIAGSPIFSTIVTESMKIAFSCSQLENDSNTVSAASDLQNEENSNAKEESSQSGVSVVNNPNITEEMPKIIEEVQEKVGKVNTKDKAKNVNLIENTEQEPVLKITNVMAERENIEDVNEERSSLNKQSDVCKINEQNNCSNEQHKSKNGKDLSKVHINNNEESSLPTNEPKQVPYNVNDNEKKSNKVVQTKGLPDVTQVVDEHNSSSKSLVSLGGTGQSQVENKEICDLYALFGNGYSSDDDNSFVGFTEDMKSQSSRALQKLKTPDYDERQQRMERRVKYKNLRFTSRCADNSLHIMNKKEKLMQTDDNEQNSLKVGSNAAACEVPENSNAPGDAPSCSAHHTSAGLVTNLENSYNNRVLSKEQPELSNIFPSSLPLLPESYPREGQKTEVSSASPTKTTQDTSVISSSNEFRSTAVDHEEAMSPDRNLIIVCEKILNVKSKLCHAVPKHAELSDVSESIEANSKKIKSASSSPVNCNHSEVISIETNNGRLSPIDVSFQKTL